MDDDRNPRWNPYQSPTANEDGPSADTAPQPPYRLKEPLRAEGTLTVDDLRLSRQPPPGQRRANVGWLILLVMLIVILLLVGAWPDLGQIEVPLLVLSVALAAFGLVQLLELSKRKRQERQLEERAKAVTEIITEEGIEVLAAGERTLWRWKALGAARCTDRLVVLSFVGGAAVTLILPRRFFANEEDWNSFTSVVLSKLRDDQDGGVQRSRPPGPPATLAEGSLEAEELDLPIAGKGSATWEDFAHIRRESGTHRRVWMLRGGCLGPFFLIAAIVLWLAWDGPHEATAVLLVTLATLGLLWLLFFHTEIGLRRDQKRREGFFAVVEIRAGEEGVRFATSTTSQWRPWSSFAKFVRTDRFLRLYLQDHHTFHYISRTLFSDDQWDALVRLVEEKVPADQPLSLLRS